METKVVVVPKVDIHIDDIIEGIYRALAVKGRDFVYSSEIELDGKNVKVCRYFEDDESPSCILGQALDHIEEARKELLRNNFRPFYIMKRHFNILGVKNDVGVFYILDTLQSDQDCGVPWGDAVDKFMEEVAEIKE